MLCERVAASALLAFTLILFGNGAFADFKCGDTVHLSRKLVESMVSNRNVGGIFAGDAIMPPLLYANTGYDDEVGAVLFAKLRGRWQAIKVSEGSAVGDVFLSEDRKHITVFAMWGREGPGPYSVLYSNDGFKSRKCASQMADPQGVRVPYLLSIDDFNVDKFGKGTLIASTSDWSNEDGKTRSIKYTFDGWGYQWTKPQILTDTPAPVAGVMKKTKPPSNTDQLIKDLRASYQP